MLDTSVVVSGIGWRGEANTVLVLLARRAFVSAIAERAECLVSYDHHFLDLEKPYGVRCLRPADFIRLLAEKVS